MLQVHQAAPERAGGGQWVLCRYKELVGRGGKEMSCEADSDGKCQVAASWLLTQKEKGASWSLLLSALSRSRGRGNAAKRRRHGCATVLHPRSLAMEGTGRMERVTFLLNYYREPTQGTFMSTGTNELHAEQQKVHFQGKLGRKNQTLCGQLNIFSNFIL